MRRSEQREQAFLLVFESLFNGYSPEAAELYSENTEKLGSYALELYNGVGERAQELDGIISAHLKGWKLNRISKVSLAVLRLSVYELKYSEDVPESVAINEAVELAKKYSGKEDSAFVNGILGAVVREK